MNIDEFRESLITLLNERFPDRTFSAQYVAKLNGQSYNGITSRKEGEEMAPVIDLDRWIWNLPFMSQRRKKENTAPA